MTYGSDSILNLSFVRRPTIRDQMLVLQETRRDIVEPGFPECVGNIQRCGLISISKLSLLELSSINPQEWICWAWQTVPLCFPPSSHHVNLERMNLLFFCSDQIFNHTKLPVSVLAPGRHPRKFWIARSSDFLDSRWVCLAYRCAPSCWSCIYRQSKKIAATRNLQLFLS